MTDDQTKNIAAIGDNATVNIGAQGDNSDGTVVIHNYNHAKKADPSADDAPGTGKHRKH